MRAATGSLGSALSWFSFLQHCPLARSPVRFSPSPAATPHAAPAAHLTTSPGGFNVTTRMGRGTYVVKLGRSGASSGRFLAMPRAASLPVAAAPWASTGHATPASLGSTPGTEVRQPARHLVAATTSIPGGPPLQRLFEPRLAVSAHEPVARAGWREPAPWPVGLGPPPRRPGETSRLLLLLPATLGRVELWNSVSSWVRRACVGVGVWQLQRANFRGLLGLGIHCSLVGYVLCFYLPSRSIRPSLVLRRGGCGDPLDPL